MTVQNLLNRTLHILKLHRIAFITELAPWAEFLMKKIDFSPIFVTKFCRKPSNISLGKSHETLFRYYFPYEKLRLKMCQLSR